MEEARAKARGSQKKQAVTALSGELPKTDDSPKYKGLSAKAKILGWVKDNLVITDGKLSAGDEVALLLDKTNLYAEQENNT